MKSSLLHRIRTLIVFFVIALLLSGITAFPIHTELKWMHENRIMSAIPLIGSWLDKVWKGVDETSRNHAFLFYGFDWLAFAHIVIALLFIGPYRDPVKNKWVIQWGIVACLGIIPLAFIAGPIRGIPGFHILIDCAFGVIGIVPLLYCLTLINKLQRTT